MDHPEEFEKFRNELLEFEDLNFEIVGEQVVVIGTWPVFGKTKFIERYSIRIELPKDFPTGVPRVFETGNVLKKDADFHFHKDESACLFALPERFEKWPPGAGFRDFLEGPVRDFFFSQAYRRIAGDWPFGEWSHGLPGIFEYYASRLKVESIVTIKELLGISFEKRIFRQWKCPCNKRVRFKDCHANAVEKLSAVLPESERRQGVIMAQIAFNAGLTDVKIR